jgi:HK97 family phage major capsid protein
MPPDDVGQLVGEVRSSMEQMKKDNATLMKELRESTALAGTQSKDAVAGMEKLAAQLQGFSNKIVDMEQKLADQVIKGKASPQTLGQLVIKSDAFKKFASGESRKMHVQANTITGQEGSPAENSDTLVAPQRLPGIVPGAFRLLRVSDIVPHGTTTSNAVEFTRELAFTNNAAETAEGAQKPESALTFELVSTPVRTIAHFIKVSKQVLDDAPALASYIDTRLRHGTDQRYDAQLLNGDGTGQNISGMTDSGNYTAYTPVTGDTALDSINRAIYAVIGADYAATGIVMNPADWGAIERLKDSQANYIIGNPQGNIGPVLWGLPVVVTNAMAAGKFLCASFDIAYQAWDRQGTVVEMFEQDSDNVQKNLLTVRSEKRGCLASYRPASTRYGNLTL